MDENFDKHIPNYFDTSDISDKINEKLRSKKFCMEPITVFTQSRTSGAVATERVATKIEKQLKLQKVDTDAKRVTQKLVSQLMPYRFSTKLLSIGQI